MRFSTIIGRLGACVGVVLCGGAPAQDYLDAANAFYADIDPAHRSDLVILPAIAQMEEPPRGVEIVEKAMFQPASSSPIWREAKAWALGDAQRAALQTLDEITSEFDYTLAMAFGLPYGVEKLSQEEGGIDIIRANLHIDLDVAGTPLLAGAEFRYLSGVSDLFCLVQVEATRLADDGDVGGALEVLADGVFFARQIADRRFAEEMILGIRLMKSCLERMRDVVYLDLRGERHLTNDQGTLAAVIDRIAERTRDDLPGYIGVERMMFPTANRLAADQLVEHILTGSGVNSDTFVRTMSFLTSRGNPMMLFSQTPRWTQTIDDLTLWRASGLFHVDRVQSDYDARWKLRNPHDPLMGQQTHYEKLYAQGDPVIAVIEFPMGRLVSMLDHWQQIRLESMGTRHALALAAYEYAQNQQAPSASSVRPRWLPKIEADPLNSEYLRSNPSLKYVIPGRHIRQSVHTVNLVFTGYANFRKRFTGDDFLLYSVGADSQDNVAVEIQNTPEFVPGADYLIWPPVLSLLRENRMTLGQLR